MWIEDVVATEMRGPEEPTNAMRKYHQLTHIPFQVWCEQCVERTYSRPSTTKVGRSARRDIHSNRLLLHENVATDLITTLVGVDDSFGRCAAICVERKGERYVLGVKALAAFTMSLGQPRLIIQSDGEHSIVELVRQTCDELPRARQ